MRKFSSLAIAVLLLTHFQGNTQTKDTPQKEAFYQYPKRVQILSYEPLGNGFLSSLNCDVRFKKSHKGLGIKAGMGYFPSFLHSDGSLTLPIHINYLMGSKSHKFEIGLGITSFLILNESFFLPSGVIGYRYYAPRSRFVLNAGCAFIYIYPFPSLGFGLRL